MNKIIKQMATIAFFCGAASAQAVNYASGQPLLCAVQSVSECVAGAACEQLMPFEINMPDFFLIDPANRLLIGAPDGNVQRKTPIEYSERLDGRLILQGADDGIEGVRDGLAWSMAIDEVTGKMIASASGDDFVLAVFGACTPR